MALFLVMASQCGILELVGEIPIKAKGGG